MFILLSIVSNLLVFLLLTNISNDNLVLGSIVFQPVLLSLIAGIALRNTFHTNSAWIRQSDFLSSRSLSIALSLMGAQFVLSDLFVISWKTIAYLSICILMTCLLGIAANRFIKLEISFMLWILSGNCICGPVAISFASQVFSGEKKDIAKAIWINTLIGFILMVLLPLLASLLHLAPTAFGIWAGSSLQSTSQVVTSASMFSSESADIALIIKSIRILMLLPLMLLLKVVVTPKLTVVTNHSRDQKTLFSLISVLRSFPLSLIIFFIFTIISIVIDFTGLVYGSKFFIYSLLVLIRPILELLSRFCLSLAMFAIGYLCCFEFSRRDYRAILFAIVSAVQLVFTSYFIIRI